MWHTLNNEIEFESKADAFKWLNETPFEIDTICLYCDNDLRYNKNMFGIWDVYTQAYIKGKLPVEYY